MASAAQALAGDARWRWWELATLAALPVAWLAFPTQALLFNEVAILALFALSLDLILGYAGIVSLGHAAFFGIGAYAAAYAPRPRNALCPSETCPARPTSTSRPRMATP